MIRIKWDSEEEASVVAEASRYISSNPRATLREVATKAQSVLPKERRRPVHASLVAGLSRELKSLQAKKVEKQKEEEKMPAPIPAPSPEGAIEALAEVIGCAFAEVFSVAIKAALAKTKENISKPEPVQQTLKLPKVTIVGLLPQQQHAITEEFNQWFDLRYWKDGSSHVLKNLTRTSDVVVCMTDWISHGHIRLIEAVDASKVRLLTGTMTRLRDYLRENVPKESKV